MIVVAKTPIHHGGDEIAGIDKPMRRREYIVNGESIPVPIVSANSIRGIMRRLLADDLLTKIGVKKGELPENIYYLLFSGGSLEKGNLSIDIPKRRKIAETLTIVSVFGAAIGDAILPGLITVTDMVPIVKETRDFTGVDSELSIYDLPFEEFGTRLDDFPNKDEKKSDKAQQMLYRFETIKAGTRFTVEFGISNLANEVERSCFRYALDLFFTKGIVGGKGAVGFGRITPEGEIPIDADPRLYVDSIQDKREKILELFENMGWKNAKQTLL